MNPLVEDNNCSNDFDSISRPVSGTSPAPLERTLAEIRSGRRLEKIVASIQSFLNSQVARLDKSIAECNRAIENDRIVQNILADFETEKLAWEKDRQAEIARLQAAGEELIKGWEQLESERRK